MSHCKVTPSSPVGRTGANFPCLPVGVLFKGQNNVWQAVTMRPRALLLPYHHHWFHCI